MSGIKDVWPILCHCYTYVSYRLEFSFPSKAGIEDIKMRKEKLPKSLLVIMIQASLIKQTRL